MALLLRELEYVRPDSLEDAVRLLSELPDAGLLAGGQSLINVLKMRIGGYSTLIDISRLRELKAIEVGEKSLRVGAGVTYDELMHSMEVSLHRPTLVDVVGRIADPQVRNRGTLGGNCCYNDPTCHLPPILTAIGTVFEARGSHGTRMIPASEFFVSYYQTSLGPGEMLVALHVPKLKSRSGDGFVPLSVGGTDVLNIIAGAATVTLAEEGGIEEVVIVVTGASERPIRLESVEEGLKGTAGQPDDADRAFSLLDLALLDPPDDVHASAEYRRDMVPVFTRRALEQAMKNARRGIHD